MAYWPLIPDSLQRTVTCPGPTGLLLPVNKQLVDVLGSIVAQADVPSEEIKCHWTKFQGGGGGQNPAEWCNNRVTKMVAGGSFS